MSAGLMNTGLITGIAASAILAGRRVRWTPGTTTRQLEHAGLSDPAIGIAEIDQATVGSLVSVRLFRAGGTHEVTVNGAVTAFTTMWGAASGKCGATAGGAPERFIALEAASTDGQKVQALLVDYSSSLANNVIVADSSAVTNTTTETTFSNGSLTIDASTLKAGDVVEILAAGSCPSTNGTDTLNVKAYLTAAQVVFQTGALDVANSDLFKIHAFITIRGPSGAAAHVQAAGETYIGTPGTANVKPARLGDTAVDLSSATAVIKVTATWSVANAGDQAVLDTFIVRIHRK